jgi:hypothetical protein
VPLADIDRLMTESRRAVEAAASLWLPAKPCKTGVSTVWHIFPQAERWVPSVKIACLAPLGALG